MIDRQKDKHIRTLATGKQDDKETQGKNKQTNKQTNKTILT